MRPVLLSKLLNRLRLKQLSLIAALGEHHNLHRAAATKMLHDPSSLRLCHKSVTGLSPWSSILERSSVLNSPLMPHPVSIRRLSLPPLRSGQSKIIK
jgi:hypothetical protein